MPSDDRRAEPFDRAALERVVHAVADRLDGGWLVVGGAAIALAFGARRTTEDVDILPLVDTGEERLALMQLAEELGLPVEAVNSAADFFVRRIRDYREHVVPLHRGARSTVFRPDATLMIELKLRRLSERDLADCELVLESGEAIDAPRLLGALGALPPTDEAALAERRARLRERLARW